MTFLVPDADIASKDLLIGLSVLQRFDVDTKTLLEERSNFLDGSDCFVIGAFNMQTNGGHVSRLMLAGLNCLPNAHVSPKIPSIDASHRVNFFYTKEEQNPFPDSSFLDPVNSVQLG